MDRTVHSITYKARGGQEIKLVPVEVALEQKKLEGRKKTILRELDAIDKKLKSLMKLHGESRELNKNTRIIPVLAWPQYHSWPSVSGLRYLIFNAAENGFGCCIRKVGRRVLIDESAFFRWVAATQHDFSGGGNEPK